LKCGIDGVKMKNTVTGEAVEKALEMNFEIFLGVILPFLI